MTLLRKFDPKERETGMFDLKEIFTTDPIPAPPPSQPATVQHKIPTVAPSDFFAHDDPKLERIQHIVDLLDNDAKTNTVILSIASDLEADMIAEVMLEHTRPYADVYESTRFKLELIACLQHPLLVRRWVSYSMRIRWDAITTRPRPPIQTFKMQRGIDLIHAAIWFTCIINGTPDRYH